MTTKPTYAQLQRKVEMLEAKLLELRTASDARQSIYNDRIYDVVELKIRVKQAMAILQGEEE